MELSLRKKRILKFSIVYWLVVAFILTIFGLSFSKVPIGDYGLKANYFSPSIDRNYYLPGLYDISIGNYFILFPSTRQYLRNRTLQVTNQNQQRVTITYTLAYKLNPNELLGTYQLVGTEPASRLVGIINNIIGSYFMGLSQQQSRVTAQAALITQMTSADNKIKVIFSNGIAIQNLFINQLSFQEQTEKEYRASLSILHAYTPVYEQIQLEYQKAVSKVLSLQEQIRQMKNNFYASTNQSYYDELTSATSTNSLQAIRRVAGLSALFGLQKIFSYYKQATIEFV